MLLKVLYGLEIQEAYKRKSFKVHRVGLGQAGSFILCKIL
jgi:hypothetical protein